jgi:alkylation response protein AidB-like acyl-CoA dehydrogenase
MRIQRLKDKLGNRSNASAEVEFDAALAWQVGAAGRGVPTIIEMVSATRLDCVLGSAASMRQGCVAAVHHASWRQVFGKDLISQPLMTAVLADLVVESEAATTLAVRLAGAAERAARGDAQEAALLRVDLHARARPRRRSAGMPGRQRLRRGVRPAAPVPRGAAELNLGGVGQRDGAGRAARAGPHHRPR